MDILIPSKAKVGRKPLIKGETLPMLANVTTSLLYMLEYSFVVHRCILVKNGKLRENKFG
jgi:hypothetical protein